MCMMLCNLFLSSIAFGQAIVFVHLGPTLPEYSFDAFAQARLFNPKCPIYVIANRAALYKSNDQLLKDDNFHAIEAESLSISPEHALFLKNSNHERRWGSIFWLYASERFFYLDEFMQQYNIQDVYHLENDNMLYVDLADLIAPIKQNYSGIAAVFDNDNRCIPGFMYIAHKHAMKKLVAEFAQRAALGLNDMQLIAQFKNKNSKQVIDSLPLIMDEYIDTYGLKSPDGDVAARPRTYSNKCDVLNSIFDGAALGQYLGGTHTNPVPGFINETTLFNPSLLSYQWIIDGQGRSVPFAVFNGKKYRINNLHIHSKQLHKFSSIR